MARNPTFRALRAAVVLPWRAQPGVFVGQLVMMAGAGLAPVAAAWLLRDVLNALTGQGRHAALLTLVVALAAASGIQEVLPALSQYLAAQAGRAIERLTTAELFAAVIRLAGLRRMEDPAFLDQLNAAQRVGMSGAVQAVTSAVGAVQAALTVTGFLAVLLAFSPVMALVVLAATVPGLIAEASVARRRAVMLERVSHGFRRQYFYANLLSGSAAAKEMRLFGLGAFFRGRMLAELRDVQKSGQRVDRRQAVIYGMLATLSALVAGAGLWWAVSATARGQAHGGRSVDIRDRAGGDRHRAERDHQQHGAWPTRPCSRCGPTPTSSPKGPTSRCRLIRHPRRRCAAASSSRTSGSVTARTSPWVLRGVSLVLPHGQAVALVGRNGAGKSTLVKLLCRFYDPDRGRIRWDGVDLRDMDLAELRDRISAVFQDYMRYELSARENIAVGDLAPGRSGRDAGGRGPARPASMTSSPHCPGATTRC